MTIFPNFCKKSHVLLIKEVIESTKSTKNIYFKELCELCSSYETLVTSNWLYSFSIMKVRKYKK